MKYKKWSLAEKLEILASCDEISTVKFCHKYIVSTCTLHSWKKKLSVNR
jgi:putative transposase